jgi:hypothetical protein
MSSFPRTVQCVFVKSNDSENASSVFSAPITRNVWSGGSLSGGPILHRRMPARDPRNRGRPEQQGERQRAPDPLREGHQTKLLALSRSVAGATNCDNGSP